MKKFWEGIKEKVIVGLILSMIGIGGTFLYNAGQEAWNLPKTVRELKLTHTQDSIRAVKYIFRYDSLCRVVKEHGEWLEEDYKNIQVLKSRTNRTTNKTSNQSLRQTLNPKTK